MNTRPPTWSRRRRSCPPTRRSSLMQCKSLLKRLTERNVKGELVALAIKYKEFQNTVTKHNNLLIRYKNVIAKLEQQIRRDTQLNKAIWFAVASRKETKEKTELVEQLYYDLEDREHGLARKDEQIKIDDERDYTV